MRGNRQARPTVNREGSGETFAEDLAEPLPAVAGGLPSLDEEAHAFRRLRVRTLRTIAWQTLSLARFRLGLVILLSGLLWFGVFELLHEGFRFLHAAIPHVETQDQMLHTVFAAFFLALLVMLLFSSGIVLYGSLFRSRGDAAVDAAGTRRPGLSAQVSRGGRPEQLGIPLAGKPSAPGFRDGRRGSVVLLRRAPAVHDGLHLHPHGAGRHLLLALVRLRPAGRQATVDSRRRRPVEPGVCGRLVAGGRPREQPPHARLVPGSDRPAAIHPVAAAAKLVAQRRPVGGGPPERGRVPEVPRPDDRQRLILAGTGDRRGGARLPRRPTRTCMACRSDKGGAAPAASTPRPSAPWRRCRSASA